MSRKVTNCALWLFMAAAALATAVPVHAENIEGTVVIKKKLTKRRVTAQVPMYERGTAVDLGADQEGDPLAFERTRVAVYLEGQFPPQASATPLVATMEQTQSPLLARDVGNSGWLQSVLSQQRPDISQRFLFVGPKNVRSGELSEGRYADGDVPGTGHCLRQLPFASEHDRDDCGGAKQMEHQSRSRGAVRVGGCSAGKIHDCGVA